MSEELFLFLIGLTLGLFFGWSITNSYWKKRYHREMWELSNRFLDVLEEEEEC